MEKLEKGKVVTITIPFSYQIGDEGVHTGKVLETKEDVYEEFWLDLENMIETGTTFYTEIDIQ